jgi:hypothetical protein
MTQMAGHSLHTFHIPVMGTGFTIDAPLRVARYGISSVISLVDDVLIEQMREYHCTQGGEPFQKIDDQEEDARARRITAYLNLLDRLVRRQVRELQASPFQPGSEISRYYEMLPESPARRAYWAVMALPDGEERLRGQGQLRQLAVPGSIDVNIMVKGDRELNNQGARRPPRFSDALAALRGFANSALSSSVIFSAGLNPRLYSYAAEFQDFFPDDQGAFKKKIILKVSDYRSAEIQGKFLAKRGLWVSEYRIESGLNCGGHVFPTRGHLLGPVLREFQQKRKELGDLLQGILTKALARRVHVQATQPYPIRVTVQGGIGTAAEDALLREHYGVDGTGWGTPFLLVPEVTNVDDEHLEKLCAATAADVYLSNSSPLGVPFWNLRTSASEVARRRRITEGHPGSPCSKGYLKLFNTEFTQHPICTASREYQERKLRQLPDLDLTAEQRTVVRESVLAKSCICHDLGGGVSRKTGIDPRATPAVCCGPSIIDFSRSVTLEEMVSHIYGRISLVTTPERPHMFLRELALYIDYLDEEYQNFLLGLSSNGPDYFLEFRDNLLAGMDHCRHLAEQFAVPQKSRFLDELKKLGHKLETVVGQQCTQRPPYPGEGEDPPLLHGAGGQKGVPESTAGLPPQAEFLSRVLGQQQRSGSSVTLE